MTGAGQGSASRDPDEASASWTLATPEDFRLPPTVYSHGGFRYAPFHWDREAETLIRVLRTGADRPRTVVIEEEVVERVEVVTGGGGAHPEEIRTTALRIRTPGREPDEEERAEVDEAVVYMLGLARPVHGFHQLCRDTPSLRRIPEMGAGRLLRAPTLWEDLAKTICASEAGWERTPSVVSALCALAPADRGRHAWPRPEAAADAGAERIRQQTGLGSAADHLDELARRIVGGELDVRAAESGLLDPSSLSRLLRSVTGIGDRSADRLLILYGATDRIPTDEAAVAFLRDRRFGGRTPTADEIRARYERFGEWKGLAYWFEEVQATLWPELGLVP